MKMKLDASFRKPCEVCGTVKELNGEWAYKRRHAHGVWYYCSWKCLRAHERAIEEEREARLKVSRAKKNAAIKEAWRRRKALGK